MPACLSPAGALFTASVDSDAAYVELLISNGMDPNTSDYNQRTPLHLAASNGHVHIVQFLCSQQVMIQSACMPGAGARQTRLCMCSQQLLQASTACAKAYLTRNTIPPAK